MPRRQWPVIPLVVVAIASLLTGMWSGLVRIGWSLPTTDDGMILRHGGLMVVGFAGTVIAVERAVAVRTRVALLAPLASAATGGALLVGAPISALLALVAGIAYAWTVGALFRRQPQPGSAAIFGGGLCLLAGAVAWLILNRMTAVVPWWMAFLVLTISGERLELTRFQRGGRLTMTAGGVGAALLLAGAAVAMVVPTVGSRLLGGGMVAVALATIVRDPSRRTVRTEGVARFSAVGVLVAYGWLAVAGVLLLSWGLPAAGPRYDASIHTFFTGYMFSAIIAHEPIIAPAVSGRPFAFSRLLFVPLGLLSVALMARIAADAAGGAELRRWAGLAQVLALLLLLALTVRGLLRGRAIAR